MRASAWDGDGPPSASPLIPRAAPGSLLLSPLHLCSILAQALMADLHLVHSDCTDMESAAVGTSPYFVLLRSSWISKLVRPHHVGSGERRASDPRGGISPKIRHSLHGGKAEAHTLGVIVAHPAVLILSPKRIG